MPLNLAELLFAVVVFAFLAWLLLGPLPGSMLTAPVSRMPDTRYCPSQSLGGIFVPCHYVQHRETPA